MYMPLRNVCARMRASTFDDEEASQLYAIAWRSQLAPGTDQVGAVHAISAETGATTWMYEQRAATMALAATGGGLVFGGDVNGRFRAFDDRTGEILWEINLGSPVSGFPITYAVAGRQLRGGRRRHRPLPRSDAGAAAEQRQQPVRVRPARTGSYSVAFR